MVIGDLLIASSYFAIPLMLLHFLRKRPDLPFRRVFVLFMAFILLCEMTHAWDIVTTWIPS